MNTRFDSWSNAGNLWHLRGTLWRKHVAQRQSVGSACRVVGRPVQARRANVQARRANKGDCVKFAPGVSRKNPGASLGFKWCQTPELSARSSVFEAMEARARLQFLKMKSLHSHLLFDVMSQQISNGHLNFWK